MGNFDSAQHGVDYADDFRVVPRQTEELSTAMMQLHSTCSGQSPPVAEMLFLHKVKWVVDYGIDRHKVVGDGGVTYHLGLTPTGIVVSRNDTRVGNYLWPRVVKLDYKKERFSLRVRDKSMKESVFAFNAKSKAAAKHLWKCAASQKEFFTTTRVENPMVAHRLMAGVSSAPQRKSKYVLPPSTVGRRSQGSGGDGVATASATTGGSTNIVENENIKDPASRPISPSKTGPDGVHAINNNNNNDDDDGAPISPVEEKIRASSPTSIVDGRRQKSGSEIRHSFVSSPDQAAAAVVGHQRRDDDYGAGSWEAGGRGGGAATGGLFTAAGGSPLSTRSSHSSRYRRRPQSESEYSHKMGHHHRHRSRKSAGVVVGENGEDAAAMVERRQRKKSRGSRHSRGDGESGSEAGSQKSRKRHGRHHQQRQDVMVDSGAQWAQVQQEQQQRRRSDRVEGPDKENEGGRDDSVVAQPGGQPLPQQSQKKYRTRSKSPKTSKGALPPEIIQHIHHDLVDPRGFSDEQLRDIPFTNVETQQRPRRISPHARAGRTALNAAVFNEAANSRHPGDGAEMQAAPVYRPGFTGASAVKTALVTSPAATSVVQPTGSPKTLGQLKDEMTQQQQQQRPKSWRHQMQQQQQMKQQQQQRGEIGAVPATGGGAFYFPNGIPSGYFSDATCNDVWADDEMEADM